MGKSVQEELVLCYKTNTANHCNVQIFTVPLKNNVILRI